MKIRNPTGKPHIYNLYLQAINNMIKQYNINDKNMESKEVVLSIDGATKTGWAIYEYGRITEHGTKRFMPSKKLSEFWEWLHKMKCMYEVTGIVAEDIYRDRSGMRDKAFQSLAEMQGVLKAFAGCFGITVEFISPLTVKRHMIPRTGKHDREEDKRRMIGHVTRTLGYVLESEGADDEADAIGIMSTYCEMKGIPVEHPKGMKR